MANTRTIALVAVGVLAVAAAAIIGASLGDDEARSAGARRPVATASASPTATATPTTSAAPSRAAGSPAAPAPAGRTPSASAGAGSGSGSGRIDTEILPTPAGDSGPTGYSLPPVPTAKPAPLLGSALPRPATAKHHLVRGFPTALAPPRGTAVESSSVAVADGVLQAALVATGGDPRSIVSHYRVLLSARGFTEQKTPAVENAPAGAFTKGKDNVTVTTVDGKTYLLANLRPKGA